LAVLGAATPAALAEKVERLLARVKEGFLPPIAAPDPGELAQPERLALDFGDGGELAERLQKAKKALGADAASSWRALQTQGIFRGRGPKPGKVALISGGGSGHAPLRARSRSCSRARAASTRTWGATWPSASPPWPPCSPRPTG
jgi:hypothetical protein